MTTDTDQVTPSYRISAQAALAAAKEGALLIDVRGANGRVRDGEVDNAIIVRKTQAVEILTRRITRQNPEQPIIIFCSSIKGSEPVVLALQGAGVQGVLDVDGGAPALLQATAD